MRCIVVLGCLLVGSSALAQTKPPAKAAAEQETSATAPQAASSAVVKTSNAPSEPVQIVPLEDKDGWVTVEVPGGFYRYEMDKEQPSGSDGGVTIIPATQAQGALRPRQPSELPPAPQADGSVSSTTTTTTTTAEAAPPNCEQERGLLNQRLWELRGVFVDPMSANVLSDAEVPLRPAAYAGIAAYGPGLAPDLSHVVSVDTPARELLANYAACVNRAKP